MYLLATEYLVCNSLNCLLIHTKDSDRTNREKTTQFESRERIE